MNSNESVSWSASTNGPSPLTTPSGITFPD
jgi:hypothetical protein